MPDVPFYQDITLSEIDARELIRISAAPMLRWTSHFDSTSNREFYYVVCEEFKPIDSYDRKKRNLLRNAGKRCRVIPDSKALVATKGFEVYRKAYHSYVSYFSPLSETDFTRLIMNSKNEVWAVISQETDQMIAYAEVGQHGDYVEYSMVKFHPDFLRWHNPSEALFYSMNYHYLVERKFRWILDGARALSHSTNVQEYLIDRFNFTKKFCDLHVVYRRDIELFVRLFYPFRKIFDRHKSIPIFQRILALLRHEEIVRKQCIIQGRYENCFQVK